MEDSKKIFNQVDSVSHAIKLFVYLQFKCHIKNTTFSKHHIGAIKF